MRLTACLHVFILSYEKTYKLCESVWGWDQVEIPQQPRSWTSSSEKSLQEKEVGPPLSAKQLAKTAQAMPDKQTKQLSANSVGYTFCVVDEPMQQNMLWQLEHTGS